MKRSEILSKILMEIPGDEYWGADYEAAERVLKVFEEATGHKWDKEDTLDTDDEFPRSGAV